MLLLIDIGNTNITTGFYNGGIKNVMRLKTTLSGQYVERVKAFITQHRMKTPEHAIICSVIPQVTRLLIKALRKNLGLEPINVTYKLKTGLTFSIKKPAQLGADRLANAAAARMLYKGHLIVIDFGTATTFCVVSAQGEYKGGAIMPGLGISAHTLSEKTAKLPKVKLNVQDKILGGDTRKNIVSGIMLGHAGAVERIIKEIKKELSRAGTIHRKIPVKVVATGGFASLIVPYIRGITCVNPFLTLEGLRIIYDLNA
ncbi:MAG: type III pantothenate kinase [Thermodesulfovibrionia bacterium]|nr:type III pantothenate kinase [Thermodesulfovibrionia bacterium]